MRTNNRRGRVAAPLLAALSAVGGLASAGVPRAPEGPPALLPAGGGERPAPGADRWQASIGMRASLLRDPGFDPFSNSNGLAQISFAVTHALGTGPGVVPALGLALDLGGADAFARGADARLSLSRLAIVLEPRFVPRPGFYLAARLVPGMLRATATLRDASTPVSLTTSYWTPTIDASLGAGIRLNGWSAPAGLWVLGEGGYGWAPRRDLTLTPALPAGDEQKAGAISLGSFTARGPFLRVSVALTY